MRILPGDAHRRAKLGHNNHRRVSVTLVVRTPTSTPPKRKSHLGCFVVFTHWLDVNGFLATKAAQ